MKNNYIKLPLALVLIALLAGFQNCSPVQFQKSSHGTANAKVGILPDDDRITPPPVPSPPGPPYSGNVGYCELTYAQALPESSSITKDSGASCEMARSFIGYDMVTGTHFKMAMNLENENRCDLLRDDAPPMWRTLIPVGSRSNKKVCMSRNACIGLLQTYLSRPAWNACNWSASQFTPSLTAGVLLGLHDQTKPSIPTQQRWSKLVEPTDGCSSTLDESQIQAELNHLELTRKTYQCTTPD